MSRKKKSREHQKNTQVATVKNIDERILAREILQAYKEFECKKKSEEEKCEREIQREWSTILGQKDYPEKENLFWKTIHRKRNDIVALYRLLFFRRKDIRDPRATFALMSLATMGIFSICKWMLYIFVLSIVVAMLQNEIGILWGASIALALWMLARIFRMAAFEVEKIRDSNLLIAIFSGVLSFVGVVIAVVAIIVDKI